MFQEHAMARKPLPVAAAEPSPTYDENPMAFPLSNTAAVLSRSDVWRGRTRLASAIATLSTGNAELDALLPGGGWPVGALIEMLAAPCGIGELSLFLPALARLAQQGRRIVAIAPPYPPYAPALEAAGIPAKQVLVIPGADAKDALWSAEQCLRSGCLGATLCWTPQADDRALKRLQLAAEGGAMLALAFRPLAAERNFSPAALRLKLTPTRHGAQLEILKCRGALGLRRSLELLSNG
jgi:hypothetical protein